MCTGHGIQKEKLSATMHVCDVGPDRGGDLASLCVCYCAENRVWILYGIQAGLTYAHVVRTGFEE